MSKRLQTEPMKQVIKEARCCELCGSSRTLEAHHIIPLVCGGPDSLDNLIAVCGKCHSILTPRSVLCKMGIEQAKYGSSLNRIIMTFYKRIDNLLDSDPGFIGAAEIMDVFDGVIEEERRKRDFERKAS